jgi:hypothetical protein
MKHPFTADSTVQEIVSLAIEKGFFRSIREQIKVARDNPRLSQVKGVDQFDRDVLPLLRLIGDPTSSAVPKELEPEWLAEIDTILDRVRAKLYPPTEE